MSVARVAHAVVAAAVALTCAPGDACGQQRAPWHPFIPVREPERPSQSARVGYEFAGAFAGLVGGSVAVLGAGCLLSQDSCPFKDRDWGGFSLIMAASALLSLPSGVTVAGNTAGGDGGFGWSLLGTLGGAVVGIPAGLLVANAGNSTTRTARYIGAGSLIVALPLAGAIVGYELSTTSAPTRRRRLEMSVLPTFNVSPDGASAGATVVF